jgi:hypothetical protein
LGKGWTGFTALSLEFFLTKMAALTVISMDNSLNIRGRGGSLDNAYSKHRVKETHENVYEIIL